MPTLPSDAPQQAAQVQQWIELLQPALTELAAAQQRGTLIAPIGALVLDWDYGDDAERVRVEVLPFDYDDAEAAEVRFLGYVPPERALLRDLYVSAPPVTAQDDFERIAAAVGHSPAFAQLRTRAPLYFTWQENGVGHRFFAVVEPAAGKTPVGP